MKIIGYERSDFRTQDGTEVKGCNVYIARQIQEKNGKGQAAERLYVSDNKADKMGIDLAALVGKEVSVFYNRFGRIEMIRPE